MTYYKATRPDATDFRTGTILYEVGKVVKPAPHDGKPWICGPGYLHAADVPAETLVGGAWPCRLFEVKGRRAVGFGGKHPHKGGFRSLTVLQELPAHLAFGPNGQEVVALIERCATLTPDEVRQLWAAWDPAWAAAWDPARYPAWAAARYAAWNAAGGAARDAAGAAAWNAAEGAAWDAALALVTRDLISTEHFDLLYGPWKVVIG